MSHPLRSPLQSPRRRRRINPRPQRIRIKKLRMIHRAFRLDHLAIDCLNALGRIVIQNHIPPRKLNLRAIRPNSPLCHAYATSPLNPTTSNKPQTTFAHSAAIPDFIKPSFPFRLESHSTSLSPPAPPHPIYPGPTARPATFRSRAPLPTIRYSNFVIRISPHFPSTTSYFTSSNQSFPVPTSRNPEQISSVPSGISAVISYNFQSFVP